MAIGKFSTVIQLKSLARTWNQKKGLLAARSSEQFRIGLVASNKEDGRYRRYYCCYQASLFSFSTPSFFHGQI